MSTSGPLHPLLDIETFLKTYRLSVQSLEAHTTLETIVNFDEIAHIHGTWGDQYNGDTALGKYETHFRWSTYLGHLCFLLAKGNITNLQLRDGSLAKLSPIQTKLATYPNAYCAVNLCVWEYARITSLFEETEPYAKLYTVSLEQYQKAAEDIFEHPPTALDFWKSFPNLDDSMR